MAPLLAILAHHEDLADPAVLEKVKHQLDAILGLGGGASAAFFGTVLLLIPVSILTFYYFYRRRMVDAMDEDGWGPEQEP